MELRSYQREAVDALWSHIRDREDNPCIVLPTGAGKGVILAQIAKDVVVTAEPVQCNHCARVVPFRSPR